VSRRPVDAIGVVAGWLARAGLLALWAAMGWGTLLLLASAAGALRDGPRAALGRLLPAPGAGPWAWLNGLTAAIATVAWLIAAGLVMAARWPRRPGSPRADALSGTPARADSPPRPSPDEAEIEAGRADP
jgi:hypothetical protein